MSNLSAHDRRRLTQQEQAMTDDEVHDAALRAARELVAALMACRDADAVGKEAEIFEFWVAAHERQSPPDRDGSVQKNV